MQLRSLRHIIEAVTALVHPDRITVMGSASLLSYDPSLGDPGQPLELSLDADLLIEPSDEGQAAVLHESLGEGRPRAGRADRAPREPIAPPRNTLRSPVCRKHSPQPQFPAPDSGERQALTTNAYDKRAEDCPSPDQADRIAVTLKCSGRRGRRPSR